MYICPMKETKKIKQLIKSGITKTFIAQCLCISRPTLEKRLLDGKYSKLQKEKINNISI